MVEEFKAWLKKNESKISQWGLTVSDIYDNKSCEGISDSIVITHETLLYIGQITVRNDGFINIEVLSQKSGELDFYIYCMTHKGIDFDLLLGNYLEYMKS